jgi:hypothetical protein
MNAEDDLLALLGVTLPPPVSKKLVGEKKPSLGKAPAIPSNWSDGKSFQFGGYLAKTVRHTCGTCEGVTEILVGLFIEELHRPSGARRLTQMGRGANWPMGQEHRCEITEERVEVCALCIRTLGFSRLVDGKGLPYSLVVKG